MVEEFESWPKTVVLKSRAGRVAFIVADGNWRSPQEIEEVQPE